MTLTWWSTAPDLQSLTSVTCQVVRDLDPVEYGYFLEGRREEIKAQDAELAAVREAKLLRTK